TNSGVASSTEDTVPATVPTDITKARSFSVPAPSRPTPMTNRASTGSSVTSDVVIDRINTWLTARLDTSANVFLVRLSRPLLFSLILSNTTTVSYSEKPRMVSRPMIVDGVTSKPTSEYTPAV